MRTVPLAPGCIANGAAKSVADASSIEPVECSIDLRFAESGLQQFVPQYHLIGSVLVFLIDEKFSKRYMSTSSTVFIHAWTAFSHPVPMLEFVPRADSDVTLSFQFQDQEHGGNLVRSSIH